MEVAGRGLTRLLPHTTRRALSCNKRPSINPTCFAPRTSTRQASSATSSGSSNARARPGIVLSTIIASSLAAGYIAYPRDAHAEAPSDNAISNTGRKIRLADVKNHGKDANEYWIIHGTRVYDITDWVPNHPGGEVVLRGVGGVVDPYWKIFSIHNKKEVYDILEQYYIGDVDPQDLVKGAVPQDDIEDPFQNDPHRDERLKQITERPCNAETPASDLSSYITPNDLFYVRNHMWVPEDEDKEHKLTIELHDGEEKVYTMEDLRNNFKQHEINAVLQCSGNRRAHMSQEARKTNGLQWQVGAIGNAHWKGVMLRDVLKDAGLNVEDPPEEVQHAQFASTETYAASIPIEKAIERKGDVMLAYEMNGEPLPRDHGYPLRVVVPGNVAARSVKWVNRITLSEDESHSQWQRRDYKCFGPNEGSKPNWDAATAIQEMPVQSAITSVKDVNCLGPMSKEDHQLLEVFGLEEDCVKLEGYALSGGGRKIVRVDVSADNGHTWNQAEILNDGRLGSKAWDWQRWRFGIPQRQCGRWFLVKAVDEAYNTQSEDYESQYNFRGNLTTAWHRVAYKAPE